MQPRKGGDIVFPIISQWELSVAMVTRVLVQSVPKPYAAFPPTPVMLHIKFDQDWPTGFRDIQVWKCGRRRTTTDGGPLVYYKLTLWAFGSGELIIAYANTFQKADVNICNIFAALLSSFRFVSSAL